ncbi:MAG: AAA family ATPase [Lunatimonas sp.]|uniref:DEAD/DEAH box helicase n=1 Tax=Lunatimonas sp. TaxID=2060141 RepID=UPI00263BDE53|nr:AAA domain-containing protein [Lunatimonas sp.]MCC5938646.1 AAA family ATPase [Lunatimonas sp.]
MSFSLSEDHFLFRLGEHFHKEGDIEKEENRGKENLSIKEKIREGYLIESAVVTSVDGEQIVVDISDAEGNFSDGSALKILELKTGNKTKGTLLSSDGQYLSIESIGWRPNMGDNVSLVKHFTAFDFLIMRRTDDFYRLLRTKKNVDIVEQKLNGTLGPIQFSIPTVVKLGNLDTSQINAINQCLGDDPVTLVQGPPGTGKTFFAAHLSKYLLDRGYEILVTAFTHDAINNILIKTQEIGAPVSKIGTKSKCSEVLQASRKEKISTSIKEKKVVGMTIHEFLKNHKRFDFILVDEASQMDMVSGIHFLASSTKTIFIGDDMQLPNIPKIPDTEFSISIFDLLLKVYKASPLLTTYRFNQRICDYISPNFYYGKLTCSDSAKSKYLDAPIELNFSQFKVLTKEILKEPLVFVNTEEEVEFLINKEQASLIADLVEDFLSLGIEKDEIGVIAPNNMQLNFIRKVLSARKLDWKGIKIETVNKFQGLQKDIILFSSVITKLGSEKVKYDFFFDIRRFNVAVSRAKKMAIVLGNRNLIAKAGTLAPEGDKIADFLKKSFLVNKLIND